MRISSKQLNIIKSLVGDMITSDDLEFIDCFIHNKLSIFIPIGGSCGYAVTPKHNHPAYMFVIPYDNQTEVYIHNKKLTPKPNSIFCLSPDILHHEVQNYLPPKYCAIFIKKEIFEKNYKLYAKPELFNGKIIDIKTNRLELLLQDFINESNNQYTTKEVILEHFSELITHEIIRNIVEYKIINTTDSKNKDINKSINFIKHNYDQNITIEDLTKLTNLSKSYFNSLFTKEMNQTPMQYLKNTRLDNAKKMLRANQLPITIISAQCGFNSPSYFTKLFKQQFKITPKEYIK